MLSIIILTLNSRKFIELCLNSVFAQEWQDFEVIIIDNGSKDGTPHFIRENYPEVILIENKHNLGACKARNQGIEKAKGEWILTLDCDVILEKDFIKKIMAFAGEQDKSIGMFQPKILNIDRKTIYSCGIYLSKLKRFYDIGKGKIDNEQFGRVNYIFGACSAASLCRRDMLQGIKEDSGYFDERFFFLVEDVDLAWRVQKKGWKAVYYPQTICYHAGNSSNTPKKLRQYLCFRNRYYMLIKNKSLLSLIVHFFLSLPYDMPRLLYFFGRNKHSLKAIWEIAQCV